MSEPLQKAAFLVISAINPATEQAEYLFMTASENSSTAGKLRVYGGMVDDGESIAEGLWRELTEEISEQAADILINDHKPHYLHDEIVTFDNPDWHDTHDYAYGITISYDDFQTIVKDAHAHQSTEIGEIITLSQTELMHGIQQGTLDFAYRFEEFAVEKTLQQMGLQPVLQLDHS